MNILSAQQDATVALTTAGVENARRESGSLLSFTLGRPFSFLIAHPEYELTIDEATSFERSIRRRTAREPLQYITGKQEFYGLDFAVSRDVLIPRPETEILVGAAIEILSPQNDPVFCELGVGSGCISVSILHEIIGASGVGSDISASSLTVAAANAAKHNVADRLTLKQGDLFENIHSGFDLIVSNPPYVPEVDRYSLQPEVRDFEPSRALFAGFDGLNIIRKLVADSPAYLRHGAFLLMEIGFGQSEAVKQLFDSEKWESVEFLPDLQGIPRVVKARLSE